MSEENAAAKKLAQDLLDRAPLVGAIRMMRGEILRTEGDADGAIRDEQRVLEQGANNITATYFLTLAYLDKGKFTEARSLLEGQRALFANNYMWRHAWALSLAAEGKRKEALLAMDEPNLKFADGVYVVTVHTADFYALLGDSAKAITWLEKGVRNGDERLQYFRRNPRLASIRQDPRSQQIIESVAARRRIR